MLTDASEQRFSGLPARSFDAATARQTFERARRRGVGAGKGVALQAVAQLQAVLDHAKKLICRAETVEVASTPASYQLRVNATRGEALDRMAAVAALQALDAVSANESAVSRLINDPRSRDCFEMAQLQLYQCMSAARFRYENAFCLGQHGLRDIGACIGAVGQPDTAAMTPINSGSSRH